MKKIFSLLAAFALVMSAAAVPFAQRVSKSDKAVVRFDAETARQPRADVAVKFDKGAQAQVAAAPVRLEIAKQAKQAARPQYVQAAKALQTSSLDDVVFAIAYYGYVDGWYVELFGIDGSDTTALGAIIYDGGDATHMVATNVEVNDSTNTIVEFGVQDTLISVSGTFSVAFDHIEQGVPFYHVTSDELNSENDAMDVDITFPVYWAIDFMKYYYALSYPEYCGLLFDCDYEIELEDAPFVPSGDTVFVTLSGLKYADKLATEGWWQLSGYNADSSVYVTFSNSDELELTQAAGTYDFATEMDKSYTAIYYFENDEYNEVAFKEGTVVLSIDSIGVAHIDADLHAKNGDVYIFDLTSKAPVVSDNVLVLAYANGTLNITASNNDQYFLFIESKDYYDYSCDDFAQATLNGEAEYWLNQLSSYKLLSMATLSGNQAIDVADFYGQFFTGDMEDGEYVAIASAIDGADRAGDAVYALFDYVAPAVVPTGDTVRIVATGAEFEDQVSAQGWWQLMGYSDDMQYFATFSNIENDQIAGTYDYAEDMDKEYTALYLITDPTSEDGFETISLKSGTIVVTVEEGVVKLHAELLGKDGNVYVVDMSSEGTAVDNVTVRANAVKRIVNGQLVIELGGEVYNAQGIRQ